MGRPLNKKYFGNTNAPDFGVGGEALASVALGTAGTGYSQGLTATVSAPSLPGVNATVSVAVDLLTGAITGYTVTNGGSGYTSAPTITLVQPTAVTIAATGSNTLFDITVADATGIFIGMEASGTGVGTGAKVTAITGLVVTVDVANTADIANDVTFTDIGSLGVPGTAALTTTNANGISISANVFGAGAVTGDIVKQEASRRYLVRTAAGVGQCALVASSTPAAGEMTMTAVDSAGGTYYVLKITARRALIVKGDRTGTEFTTGADGISVPWSLDAAILNERVQILSA